MTAPIPLDTVIHKAPLSAMLRALADDDERERISVADLLDALGDRAIAALLFVFAIPHLGDGGAVTLQLDSQFLAPGREGDIIVASGEITRAGKTMIFGRGQITCGERILMTFSGVLARKNRRPSGDA